MEINHSENSFLNDLIKRLEDQCSSGFALAVLKGGQLVDKRYYGYADVSHKVEVNEETKFPIASISKIYTSLVINHLAAEGLVDIQKPLNHYVPESESAGEASVSSVLSMTAGLCDAFDMFLLSGSGNLVSHGMEEHYLASQIFAAEKQSYKDHFIYSNTGYIFLAQLVQNVTGKTYEDVLKEVILEPLGLKNTDYFDGRWRVVDNMAVPNVRNAEDGEESYIGRFYRNMAGAGHLAATLDDMVAFAKALSTGQTGKADIQTMMQRPKLINESPNFYGLGLQVIPLNNRHNMIGHNGSYHGIKTALFFEPQSQSTIVLLSNDNDLNAVNWSVEFLSACHEDNLQLVPAEQPALDSLQKSDWVSQTMGIAVSLYEDSHIRKIDMYGETKDLVLIGENKYMVPYAVAPIILTKVNDTTLQLMIGGLEHWLSPVSNYEAAPKNFMEYVGRYKNPNSDIENHVKSDFKGGLDIQFGGTFNAVNDASLKPIAKDYFMCTIQENNGSPLTLYIHFEREQFSQMISGYTLHSMRLPHMTFRRLKTV